MITKWLSTGETSLVLLHEPNSNVRFAYNSSSAMVKPTNVSVLGVLAAQYGASEGTMSFFGTGIRGKIPFMDFPCANCYFEMPN